MDSAWARTARGPSATSQYLGSGKLQLGPAAGVAVQAARHLWFELLMANNFSIAGPAERPDIDVLIAQPIVVLNLPAATCVTARPPSG